MPEIRERNGLVTQITSVAVDPKSQAEALELMKERARFMATQPGFVSISLHRSADSGHILNYVQWKDREQLVAAHRAPEFREKWPRFGEVVKEAEPCLYDVVMVEGM
jgi:heme-degrading monooxygenase HmoA